MTYKILIPHLAPDKNLDECLFTLKDQWPNIILVDNSKDSYCKNYQGEVGEVHYHPENLGVARSWNIGLRKDVDYIYIVSTCMRFPEGFQEILNFPKDGYGATFKHYGHLWEIGRKTIKRIGYFDTNFYPAYAEDNDYRRRLSLAGIELREFKTKAISIGNALTIKSGKVKVNMHAMRQHCLEKWGGKPTEEKFKHPYNNPNFPLSYFPEHTIKKLKEIYNV